MREQRAPERLSAGCGSFRTNTGRLLRGGRGDCQAARRVEAQNMPVAPRFSTTRRRLRLKTVAEHDRACCGFRQDPGWPAQACFSGKFHINTLKFNTNFLYTPLERFRNGQNPTSPMFSFACPKQTRMGAENRQRTVGNVAVTPLPSVIWPQYLPGTPGKAS